MEDKKYSEAEVKILESLAEIRADQRSIFSQIDKITKEMPAMWEKIDNHSLDITAIKTKYGVIAAFIATVVSGVTAFIVKIFGGHSS